MLQKIYKLNSTEFSHTFTTGKQVHTPHLSVKYQTGEKGFKSAVSVGKKYAKTAVLRNYKRRQMYHILEDYQRAHPERVDSLWLVVTMKKEGIDRSFQEISQELVEVIDKLGKQ